MLCGTTLAVTLSLTLFPVIPVAWQSPASHSVKRTYKVLFESLYDGVLKCRPCQCLLQCPQRELYILVHKVRFAHFILMLCIFITCLFICALQKHILSVADIQGTFLCYTFSSFEKNMKSLLITEDRVLSCLLRCSL